MKPALAKVRRRRAIVRAVSAALDRGGRAGANEFDRLAEELADRRDPDCRQMAKVMGAWSAGLFVGPKTLPVDNLDLERWFRLPKGHERRVHGHAHAGVRLVQEGPTLIPALDAHASHPGPFDAGSLLRFKNARPPPCQREAMRRRAIMRRARSKSQRAKLLHELEQQYQNSS